MFVITPFTQKYFCYIFYLWYLFVARCRITFSLIVFMAARPPALPPASASSRLVSLSPNWMSGLTQQALTPPLKCLMESRSRYPAAKEKKRHVLTICWRETQAQMFSSLQRRSGWQEAQGTRGRRGLTRTSGLWRELCSLRDDWHRRKRTKSKTLLEPSSTLKSPFFFPVFNLPLKFDCTVHKLFFFSFFVFFLFLILIREAIKLKKKSRMKFRIPVNVPNWIATTLHINYCALKKTNVNKHLYTTWGLLVP